MLAFLKAQWSGIAATYIDGDGSVVAFDPAANVPGPSAFLVKRESLLEVLEINDLAVCWAIQGEKIDAEGAPNYRINARRAFHGFFIWDGVKLNGSYSFGEIESSDEGL